MRSATVPAGNSAAAVLLIAAVAVLRLGPTTAQPYLVDGKFVPELTEADQRSAIGEQGYVFRFSSSGKVHAGSNSCGST